MPEDIKYAWDKPCDEILYSPCMPGNIVNEYIPEDIECAP